MNCYVNVYEIDRCYGGPEEGGWYYDRTALIKAFPTTTRYAREFKERLEAGEFSNEGKRPLSSVLSDGMYRVRIERHPGQSEDLSRPHYE